MHETTLCELLCTKQGNILLRLMLSWLRVPTWRLETAEARHRSMLLRLLMAKNLSPRSWPQVRV
jgi:hypothetical protein